MMELRIDMEGLQKALDEAVRRGQNLEPPLRHWAREKRVEIRETIESGRGMPPLSPKTLANYAHTGTAKITKSANVRSSYVRRLDSEKRRIDGLKDYALRKYGYVPDGIQRKIDGYHIRLARLAEQVEKARAKPASERNIGKTQAERGKGGQLLGQVPQTLYGRTAKVGQHVAVVVGSRWRKDGIHNEGDGHVPQRLHVELTGRDVERLKSLIVSYGLKPLRAAA